MDLSKGMRTGSTNAALHCKKLVRDLEGKARRMGRDLGEAPFSYQVTDRADLHTLISWKPAQYRRTGRSDGFAIPWMIRLVRELADTTTGGCTGVLSMLYADGRPVAVPAWNGDGLCRVVGWCPSSRGGARIVDTPRRRVMSEPVGGARF